MSFVAGGVAADRIIENDGWWPDIDAKRARETLRLDGAVTDTRLDVALLNAMISVNRELLPLKAGHLEAPELAAIDAPLIGGQHALVVLYVRAVICMAGAELVERHRGYDTTASGHADADSSTPTIDELRRDARWAIRDLLGNTRITVELI